MDLVHIFVMNIFCNVCTKCVQQVGMDEGFAVYPRHDCPHLPAVAPVPASGIDINSSCSNCLPDPCATLENWICLTCYSVSLPIYFSLIS